MIRYTDDKFVHRSNNKTSYLTGQFINDKDGFAEVFREKGFEIRVTEKHAYTEGFLKLLGDSAILKDEKFRDFLWRLQKKDAYNFDDLKAGLKKGKKAMI